MDNNNLNNETTVLNEDKPKKFNPVAAFFISVGALLLFWACQFVVAIVAQTIEGAKLAIQYQDNLDLLYEKSIERFTSPEFLTPVTVISQFIIVAIALIWYYFGFVKKVSKDEAKSINKNVFSGKTIATGALLGLGLYGLDVIIANIVAILIPSAADQYAEVMGATFDFASPVTFLAVVIMAPLGEELIFRGVVLNTLRKSFSKWVVVILSAVFFAVAHIYLFQILYVLPIAIVLGYVGYRYKSIIPGIIVHLVNNLLASVAAPYLPEDVALSYICFAAMMVIGLGGAFLMQKNDLSSNKAKN